MSIKGNETMISQTCKEGVVCPLQFIEFWNDGREYIGMLDSGAQINLLSFSALSSLIHERVPCCIKTVRGFEGKQCLLDSWVLVNIELGNGKLVPVRFAVIKNIETSIILGLPFLKMVKGVVDHANLILEMKEGPIALLEGRKLAVPEVATVLGAEGDLRMLKMPKLSFVEREQVESLLLRFSDLWENKRRGLAEGITHTMCLDTPRPIVAANRRYCEEHRKAIADEINKMINDGVIRPSNSQYASEIVLVKKKTGDWRVCIDYRAVNKHTIRDNYPMPRIPDLLRSVQDSSFMVALDLRSGYWQIPMESNSKRLTAFRCPQGLFEFNVMPFGLKNAPATFQRAIDFLLGDLYGRGISTYLDDILIHGKTFSSTLELLEDVFKRFKAAGFTINLEKSVFFENEIEYLGHIVGHGYLKPNQKKVEALFQIRPAKTISELRSILGMFGYYQCYIDNFSTVFSPLTNALKGSPSSKASIKWSKQMQEAIEKGSKLLAHSVLTIPIESDEFLLETDASDSTVAGILHVKRNGLWVPVEFVSKKLSGAEKNWPVREKEAFAIVFSLRKFDCYLRTRKFLVHTDHQSLKWLRDASTGKLARWASRMEEYEMEVVWKSGKEMAHVDFFTRQIDPDEDIQDRMIYSVHVDPHQLPSLQEIIAAQPKVAPVERGYLQRGNVIYYRNGVWVPEQFRLSVVAACHSLPPYSHPGVKRTKSNIVKVFNWPNLHDQVTEYVRSCLVCQRSRPGLERLQGLLQTHQFPRIFETVYMDFWHCSYQGERQVVLTMIDQSSKWVEAVHIPNQTSDTVAQAFLQTWVCRFGVPTTIVTDNDPPLVGDVLRKLACQLGIHKLRTTPYHPQGNAVVESFHKTLNRRLTLFEDRKDDQKIPFNSALQMILWSYRAIMHTTMKESPAFLVYGVDPRPPLENDWRMVERLPEQDRVKFLNLIREETQTKAYQRFRFNNDQAKRIMSEFNVNESDLVLIRQQPNEILQAATRDEMASKLVPRWSLPYRVIRREGRSNRLRVRSLMSGRIREIHITDVRAVSPPQNTVQHQEWSDVIEAELEKSAFNKHQRKRILSEFWEDIKRPQAKRAMILDKKFGGVDEKPVE